MAWVVPVVMGAAAIYGSISGNNAKKKQAQEAAGLQNKYNSDYMTGLQKYIQYMQGLGPQTTTMHGSTTSTPFVTKEFAPLVGQQKDILSRRLASGGLPAGYAETGLRAINESYAGAEADIGNAIARSGVPNSGIQAAMLANPASRARAGEMADFRAGLPLKARDMQSQDLQMAQTLSSIFGKGEKSVTNSSTTSPAPMLNMGAFLPPGPNRGTETGISTSGEAVSSAAGALGMMYGSGMFGGGGGGGGAMKGTTPGPWATGYQMPQQNSLPPWLSGGVY